MKNSNLLRQIFLLLLMGLTLSGCGFHLRGHTPLPPSLQTLFISTNEPYSDFTKELKQSLNDRDITIVEQATQAPVSLQIISAIHSQVIGSISANTNTRIYTLYFTVQYQLLDQQGQTIVPVQSISSYRTLTVNANQVLGSSIEALTLKREMRAEVIQKMIYRLAARNTRRQLATFATTSRQKAKP